MEEFSTFYDLYQNKLVAFSSGIVGNIEDAREVVNEVFIECLSRSDVTKAYLFKAVRNRSLNKRRSLANSFKVMKKAFEHWSYSLLVPEEESIELSGLIEKLPAKHKVVLELRLGEDLTLKEISEVLELPVGTVKSRMNKAIEKLRKGMRDEGL